jgi:hypothetical protein
MYLMVCGSVTKTPSIDFSCNSAAILGILGGMTALVLDCGETPVQTREYIGLSGSKGLESLLEHYLANRAISVDAFHENITKFISPPSWTAGIGSSSFDVILGPDVPSPRYSNLFRDHFAVNFIRQLIACAALEYSILIINCEHNLATIWSQEIMEKCNSLVLRVRQVGLTEKKDFDINPSLGKYTNNRHLYFPESKETTIGVYAYSSISPITSQNIVAALKAKEGPLRTDVAKCAFHFLDILYKNRLQKILADRGWDLQPKIRLKGGFYS